MRFRSRLQWRDRAGFTPASLFNHQMAVTTSSYVAYTLKAEGKQVKTLAREGTR